MKYRYRPLIQGKKTFLVLQILEHIGQDIDFNNTSAWRDATIEDLTENEKPDTVV